MGLDLVINIVEQEITEGVLFYIWIAPISGMRCHTAAKWALIVRDKPIYFAREKLCMIIFSKTYILKSGNNPSQEIIRTNEVEG